MEPPYRKAELQAIVESAMDAVISVDEDQRLVLLNPAAEKLLQCDAKQMVGESLDRFIPERFREAHHKHVQDFASSDVPRRRVRSGGMIFGVRSDGTEFPVEASISQATVDGQKLLTVVLRDLSEREANRLLIREQATMLDQVRDAIHIRDLNDRIAYWNQGSERLYGWKATEAIGENAADLLLPRHSDEVDVVRQTLIDQGAWAGEIRQVARDGRELICEHRRTLLRDDNGRPNAQLIIDIDVTARKRAEAQERRSQRLESIGTLAGGIAHDLNNVLTPIMMGAKLLARSRPESNRQGLIETILASAERGADMIKQLLAFAGGVDGKRESLQFRDVIDEIRAILDHTLPKNILVEVNIAEDLWPISGDATGLSQVLMNLCINARDAMPEGGNLTFSAENVVLDENRPPSSPDLPPGPYLLVSIVDTRVVRRPFARFFSRITTKLECRSKSCTCERRISLRRAPVWAAIRTIGYTTG